MVGMVSRSTADGSHTPQRLLGSRQRFSKSSSPHKSKARVAGQRKVLFQSCIADEGICVRLVTLLCASAFLLASLGVYLYTALVFSGFAEFEAGVTCSDSKIDGLVAVFEECVRKKPQAPPLIASHNVTISPSLLDPIDRDMLWRGHMGQALNLSRRVINPAVVNFHGVTYLAAREHQKLFDHHWWSEVVISHLAGQHSPRSPPVFESAPVYLTPKIRLPSAVRRCFLKQPGHFISGPTDPRLLRFNASVWATFSFYSTTQPFRSDSPCRDLSDYAASMWIYDVLNDIGPIELVKDSLPSQTEKNWILFSNSADDQMYAAVSIEPHVVLSVNTLSGDCHELSRTSHVGLFTHIPRDVRTHLGASPARFAPADVFASDNPEDYLHLEVLIRYSSLMLGMFHTKEPNYVYNHYFYVFEDSPPFNVLCVSSLPVAPPRHTRVSFETTIEILDNGNHTVAVWFGVDDADSGVAYFSLKDILLNLQCLPIRPVASRFVEYSSDRILREMWSAGVYVPLRWEPWFRRSVQIFNPSVLSLPRGSKYPYVAVGRAPAEDGNRFDAEQLKNFKVHYSNLVACVMDVHFTCVGHVKKLSIPAPIEQTEKRLFGRKESETGFNYDAYIGAEDGRLSWNPHTWQVFLVYAMNSEIQSKIARDLWIVDLSEIYPFLADVLAPPPAAERKLFNVPTELIYSDAQSPIEKNWIVFSSRNETYLSYSLYPRLVLGVSSSGDVHRLATNTSTSISSKLFRNIDTKLYRVNQGSGVIEAKLCERRHCKPNDPSMYFTIFHTRNREKMAFKHYVAAFESEPPFDLKSVGVFGLENVIKSAANSSDFVYVMSLDIMKDECLPNDVGYLDTLALVGVGVDDSAGGVYVCPLSRVLES